MLLTTKRMQGYRTSGEEDKDGLMGVLEELETVELSTNNILFKNSLNCLHGEHCFIDKIHITFNFK